MLLTIFTGVSYLISALLLWSGISGIFRPLHLARTLFGVPNATQETVTFYPSLAGRNVAGGLSLLSLLLMGERRAAGVVVTCLLCNGASDCYVLAMREGSESMGVHVFNMCVGAVVGPGLLLLA